MREHFIFYRSFYEAISQLSEPEQALIYQSIAEYGLNFNEPKLTGVCNIVWTLIKPQIDANQKKFIDGAKGKDYGKLGGRPKKNPTGDIKKNPTGLSSKTPNENVNDNKNDNKNVLFSKSVIFEKIKFKEAFPEWSKEKLAYYYDAVLTWSNEGNKKKDWIATVRTWAARDEKQGKIKFNVVTYSSAAHDGIL
jgi:hypothetical protein